MSRRTFVHAARYGIPLDHPDVDKFGMIDKALVRSERVETHHVIGDTMTAMRHPLNNKLYDSKAAFRAVTRMHGCTEVGNETIRDRRYDDSGPVGRDVARAYDQLSRR